MEGDSNNTKVSKNLNIKVLIDSDNNEIINNEIKNNEIKKSPKCLTTFIDGSINVMYTSDKLLLDIFLTTPYMGIDNYTTVIYQDKVKLVTHEKLKLCHHAERSLIHDNAGGASEYSEAMSIHYFDNVFNGKDFVLETEVEYWREFKMVDYICTINNTRVGVSVTRAMGFPCSSKFTKEDARQLINKKIKDLIVACDLVITKHSFEKSILHVWCQNERIAGIIKEVYEDELEIDSMGYKVLCDVAVILTISNYKSIYTNHTIKKNKILNIY